MIPPSPDRPKIFTRSFIMITVINFFIFFSFQMIFPSLPLYIKKLGGDDTIIGLVMGVFVVSSILTRPFAGLALDKIGRKRVFITGLIILTISGLSYGFATSISAIVLIRLLHGLGWGISGTSTATIAADIIPHARFGEGMGYFSLANSLAMAVGPAAGLYIASQYGFQNLFFIAAIIVGISLLMSFMLQYKSYPPDTTKFSQEQLYEPSAWWPSIVFFFVSVTWGGVVSFLPLYAISRGIADIGDFFSVYALAILISRPASGKLVDRYGYNITIIPGLIFLVIAMFLLSYADSRLMFFGVAIIYGFGFGAAQMSLQTMVVRHIPHSRLGAANATFFTGLDAGIGLGATILGAIATIMGYEDMYKFAGLSAVISLIIYLIFVRRKVQVAH